MRIIYLILITLTLTRFGNAQTQPPEIKVGSKLADIFAAYNCHETQAPIMQPSALIGKSYRLTVDGVVYIIVEERPSKTVHTIRTYDPSFQTPAGLHIGSTQSDIQAVYPAEYPFWGYSNMYIKTADYRFHFADREEDSVTAIDLKQIPSTPKSKHAANIQSAP